MNKTLLFAISAIALLFIIGNINAYYVGVDYTYVRSNSYPEFLHTQYANYNDNIDFSYQIVGYGMTGFQRVYVSPVIYAVTPNGYSTQIMVAPTTSVYMYPGTPYNYIYNNMFYFDADYLSYNVVLNVTDESGNPLVNDTAYVYSSGTTPSGNGGNTGNTGNNYVPTCSDFYVSGQTDIYMQEDDSTTYDLYLINTVNEELTVTSVTTTSPENLSVDNIDYPYTVGSYATRSINIDLTSDTIDDDFSDSFNVIVNARYGSLNCTKTYEVNYHINDQSNSSNADCSDIEIKNPNFSMNEDDTLTKGITIENNSFDYEYIIDDATIRDSTNVNAEVTYTPNKVNEDSDANIRVRFDTDPVDQYTTETLRLAINGYMKRNGHEDKHCKKYVDVTVRINDNSNGTASQDCSQIEIHSTSVSQNENVTKDYALSNGFYITNKSNNKFNISQISISDNSQYAEIINNSMNYAINGNSQSSLNFSIKTFPVSTTESTNATISVLGKFEGGETCTFSDITKNFSLNILDSSDMCSRISVYDQKVAVGENSITLQNSTGTEFYVNNIIVLNKNGLNVNIIDPTSIINPNSTKNIRIGVNGDGSAELQVAGKFKNGETCDYTTTTPGTITTRDNANFQDSGCDFQINNPTEINVSNALETFYLTFNNNSIKGGEINISTFGAVIDTPIIYLEGYDDFTRTLTLNNFDNPTYIVYNVKLNGCSEKTYYTKLKSNITSDKKIILTSHPEIISPTRNRFQTNVSVLNTYNTDKDVTVKLAGFPSDWKIYVNDSLMNIDFVDSSTSTKTMFTIGKNQTKTIYFAVVVPDNTPKTRYNGYFEVYDSGNIVTKSEVTIDFTPISKDIEVISKSLIRVNDFENAYKLAITLNNNNKITKEYTIVFNKDSNFVIDGNRTFTLNPNDNNITLEYKIVTKSKLKEASEVPFSIIDNDSGREVLSDSVIYSQNNNGKGGLTAFLGLGTIPGVIGLIVLIIIVLLVIRYIIKKIRIRRREREMRNKANAPY